MATDKTSERTAGEKVEGKVVKWGPVFPGQQPTTSSQQPEHGTLKTE
jgi:hypothetical protein